MDILATRCISAGSSRYLSTSVRVFHDLDFLTDLVDFSLRYATNSVLLMKFSLLCDIQ